MWRKEKGKIIKALSTLVLALCLFGCAEPLPEERMRYVGEWQSNEMAILILADGSVAYKRIEDGVTTSINGPIKEFQGDDFVVGFAFLTTTFNVSKPPTQKDGVWVMTVDGIELTKVTE